MTTPKSTHLDAKSTQTDVKSTHWQGDNENYTKKERRFVWDRSGKIKNN